jgi:glycosyltransferase domain-containing protein
MNENMNSLSQLTIIILSKNRQNFLKRQFEFWKDKSFYVIIIDDSPQSLIIDQTTNNITYYHSQKDFKYRLLLAIKKIDTNYAIFLPDDEFLIPSCLNSCINYLKINTTYSSCSGRTLEFHVDQKDNSIKFNHRYEFLNNFQITSESKFERVITLANPYMFQPIHSVLRKEVWLSVGKTLERIGNVTPDMIELFFGFIAAYHGKLIVIPELMNFRSFENPPIHTKEWNQSLLSPEWFFDNKFNIEKEFFFDSLRDDIIFNYLQIGFITYCYTNDGIGRYFHLKKFKKFLFLQYFIFTKFSSKFGIKLNIIRRYDFNRFINKLEKEDYIKFDKQQMLSILNCINNFHSFNNN